MVLASVCLNLVIGANFKRADDDNDDDDEV